MAMAMQWAHVRDAGRRVLCRARAVVSERHLFGKITRSYVAVSIALYVADLLQQTRDRLTDGAGRPFGDDFVNFWSGAFLAWHGRAAEIYDGAAFHAFEQSIVGQHLGAFHYSYPPVLLLLSAPLAAIPYVPALLLWTGLGWFAFYAALRLALPNGRALLFALATPAVFINAVGGQNGTWTAALLGGGLGLLDRRPVLAGGLLGLLIYKPQIGILIPVALLAGRRGRAFAAAAATSVGLTLISFVWLGPDVYAAYMERMTLLRHLVLEDGTGVWHRMVSIFVAARRLGADVPTAYLVQAVSGAAAALAVVLIWYRDASFGVRNAVLVIATCLATPYLQDYDLVFSALVVAWLWQEPAAHRPSEWPLLAGASLFLVLPLCAALLCRATGLAWGPLFILPLFVVAVRSGLAESAASRRRCDHEMRTAGSAAVVSAADAADNAFTRISR